MESQQENDPLELGFERKLEALLFASDSPLSLSKISSMTGISSAKDIKAALKTLEDFYRSNCRSFGIFEVAGGYQLVTLPEFAGTISVLFKNKRKARLSQAGLETLAIIAYKQPISRLDVEAIRGVNCDGVIATLIERELITITGRGDGAGKPYLYSTTNKFLEYLGLKDFRDLPSVEELERSLEHLDLIPKPLSQDEVEGREDDDGGENGLDRDES